MTTTTDVPGRFDVGINGVGYMLAEDGEQPALIRQSIRTQSEQHSGANANTGEQTVNPEGFWRRSRDGWSHGAGQSYGDRETSDPERFRESSGVNVFGTRHQLTLLHALDQALTFTDLHNVSLLTTYSYTYFSDGSSLKYTSAPFTTPWSTTTVTGTPTSINALATIGSTLFVAGGAQGVYSGSMGAASVSSYATGTATGIAVAKGRLMVWDTTSLYNVVASGAFPTALITFGSGSIVGVAGAGNNIYIAVFGEPSLIYKTTIEPDGTALSVPTVAGELPAGETLVSYPAGSAIFAYLNLVFVLTNRGVRMGLLDSDGNITFGSIIPIAEGTNLGAWVAYDRFVWTTGGGPLVRLDLSVETLPITPAYANDLDTTHLVEALAIKDGRLILSDNTGTVYVESDDTYVDSGYIDSGLVALDLADPKTPVAVDLEAAYPDDSSITEALSVDRGASFTTVGTFDSGNTDEAAVSGIAASRNFEIRTTLTASTDNTETPVLYRHTLKVEPNITQGDYVIMRLRLYESQVDNTGSSVGRTPNTDLTALRALQQARTVVEFQVGDDTATGTVRDLDWEAHTRCASADDGSWNGVASLRIKVVAA